MTPAFLRAKSGEVEQVVVRSIQQEINRLGSGK
jgi:hypothetical protein